MQMKKVKLPMKYWPIALAISPERNTCGSGIGLTASASPTILLSG